MLINNKKPTDEEKLWYIAEWLNHWVRPKTSDGEPFSGDFYLLHKSFRDCLRLMLEFSATPEHFDKLAYSFCIRSGLLTRVMKDIMRFIK